MIELKRTTSDKIFSLYIRHRDKRCQLCLQVRDIKSLDCSHHFSRTSRATRWDPQNCVALCRDCHKWLSDHPTEYVLFMIRRLGLPAYEDLQRRAKSIARYVDEKAISQANRQLLAGMGIYPGRRGPALSSFEPAGQCDSEC
jgi:hypothetical protein